MSVWLGKEAEEKIRELRKSRIPVYSFSKLGTYSQCPHSYLLNYLDSVNKTGNIYSDIGDVVHKIIEEATKTGFHRITGINVFDAKERIRQVIDSAEAKRNYFPSEKAKENWIANIFHFLEYSDTELSKIKYSEVKFCACIEGKYIQGIIDAIIQNPDGSYSVVDWKTSSMFRADSLEEKGRQLLLYKYILELAGVKVKECSWCMLKYVNVYINGSGRIRTYERKDYIRKLEREIIRRLMLDSYSDDEIQGIVEEARIMNEIPVQLRDDIIVKDCYIPYSGDDHAMSELLVYISSAIAQIETHTSYDLSFWKPIEISDSNSFFCTSLCSVRDSCYALADYLRLKEKENPDDFANLFK